MGADYRARDKAPGIAGGQRVTSTRVTDQNTLGSLLVKLCRFALLVGALSIGAQSAMADASASIHFSDFSITLIDLDPSDGVTPFVSFQPPFGETLGTLLYAGVSSVTQAPQDNESASNDDPGIHQGGLISTGSVSATIASGAATAQSTPTSISLSAQADLRTTVDAGPNDFAYAEATAQPLQSFFGDTITISANTVVMFSGNLAMQASVVRNEQNSIWNYALAQFNFSGYLPITRGYQSFSQDLFVKAENLPLAWAPEDSYNQSYFGAVNVGLINPTAETLSGSVIMSLSVSAYDNTATVVPEPSTFALGLLGLAGVGVVAKRRRLA